MTEEPGPSGPPEGAPSLPQGDPAGTSDQPRSPEPTGAAEQIYYCDLCGAEMLNLHCKLVCERCGYKRDCSDP